MTDSPVLGVERDGHVAIVWLDRPEKKNAFGSELWHGLPPVMDGLSNDPEVRAVVIAGRGDAFTVGLDLVELGPSVLGGAGAATVTGRRELLALIKRMQDTMTAVARCTKPVIAAVHGWCLGAGVDLITACDIRLASGDAVFSIRETRMAMVADVGTLQRLPKIVDPGAVAELVYTGRDVPAEEARELGLVTRVYPDADAVVKAAREMASAIAANSPLAVQGSKAVLRATEGRRVDEALDYVALWNAAFLHSADLAEAVTAFLEKRPPEFTGE